MDSKKILTDLFNDVGIQINGNDPWDIQVHNDRIYKRLLRDGALGLGESYMDGWWDCDALDEFVKKLLIKNLDQRVKGQLKTQLYILKTKLFNQQRQSRAMEVGEHHYDLGNDLYEAMLDKNMNYTCAYWRNARDLDAAQENKLDLVCKKINLKPGMHVLDLGCGWGSFAKYAAEKYGAHVTSYNISREQVKYAKELCKDLSVEIKHQDYRSAEGSYDAVVAIGMLEHVGYRNYRTYMELIERTLKNDGIALTHTIGGNFSTTHANRFTDKYIFPNGMLPSIAQIGKAMERLFVMEDWHNFGPDYDKTLLAWYDNFEKVWPELKEKYGERFYRMWRYYLLSSAGGFRSRSQQLWQIVMTKPGREQPVCRFS
ncbi:MAG: cyclopropane fatty acyl phospholipid synthase [Bacteroidales bacterium]|nr:cyclopropane fatty acyl phospholipid synthase [Bacteroidales bacterium]